MSARPRPRPRPVAGSDKKDLAASSRASTSAAAAAHSGEDGDAFFMRNRARTAEQWKKLQQLTKTTPLELDIQSDQDEQFEGGSPARRPKKKQVRQDPTPRWQTVGVADLLSSGDDDYDLDILDTAPRVDIMSSGKRKRERSRSKSITPPPALSAHQLANARNLVRQVLAVEPRAPSPTLLPDDSTDTIVLDPELVRIAEAVRVQKGDLDHGGGPELVEVRVKWLPHPLGSSTKMQEWPFQLKRHDTFRNLFEAVADLASILAGQLVVTYNGKRVFPSGTPHSLRIWAEGELEACDKHTHEYIRVRRQDRDSSPTKDLAATLQSDTESEVESVTEDKLRLVLRSAVTKDVTLTVRRTTTCDTIVKAFLKAAGLPDVYSDVLSRRGGPRNKQYPRLVIDGEKQHAGAKIGDAELEDGDLVEVVGI